MRSVAMLASNAPLSRSILARHFSAPAMVRWSPRLLALSRETRHACSARSSFPTATQTSAKGPFVYVVKDDSTAELRPVTVGQRQGDLVAVAQGLKGGERVVTTGQLAVTPGGRVRSQP